MCLMGASYLSGGDHSPSTGTGGSGRQKRPRCGIFVHAENGLSIGASSAEITNLLKAWSSGDEAALSRLAERVYPELRLMARRYMKNERQANTLQTTALVHEVYLRLVDVAKVEWHQHAQFFAMAAHDAAHPGGRRARAWRTQVRRQRSQSEL